MVATPGTYDSLKFIDLFAGIGGFHIAMENAGAQCVFVSEWDPAARKTYEHNFKPRSPRIFEVDAATGQQPRFVGDITAIDLVKQPDSIEDFDILCGGFPCQPFSQAGLKKGMDEARGTLFFNILHILREKRPAAFFLENVRGLATHMSGDVRTITIIEEKLRELGYSYELFHVKASDFNVPQHRPRVFIIGFRDVEAAARFKAPAKVQLIRSLKDVDILGPEAERDVAYTLRVGGRGSGVNDRRNWDCYRVGNSVIRIEKEHGIKIQGFPDWFTFPSTVANSQAMKQLGNSVAVPAIEAYARAIALAINGGSNGSKQK